jgi:hypothetical protein
MSRQIKNADEQDAYTKWRKYLCSMSRAGAVKKIKRRTHKRERREIKMQIQKENNES